MHKRKEPPVGNVSISVKITYLSVIFLYFVISPQKTGKLSEMLFVFLLVYFISFLLLSNMFRFQCATNNHWPIVLSTARLVTSRTPNAVSSAWYSVVVQNQMIKSLPGSASRSPRYKKEYYQTSSPLVSRKVIAEITRPISALQGQCKENGQILS